MVSEAAENRSLTIAAGLLVGFGAKLDAISNLTMDFQCLQWRVRPIRSLDWTNMVETHVI